MIKTPVVSLFVSATSLIGCEMKPDESHISCKAGGLIM
jgi:hypothetical protein